MSRKYSLLAVGLALALATMACGININLPVRDIKTGPTQTDQIDIPAPTTSSADLTLAFAAGKLKLAPGAGRSLVSGTAVYNVADFKPKLTTNGDIVRIETGNLEVRGIPSFGKEVVNEWDLQLGDLPMNLHLTAGAYQATLELGGLSINSLEVGDGAADVDLKFTEPNKVEMSTLRYETGASSVSLEGLANANFRTMVFRSGAGDYTLDFSGELRRDASVDIQSGISHVVIVVPDGVNARVIFKGGLSNVDAHGQWEKSGDTWSQTGSGPTLTIQVDMGAGNLELRN